MLDQNDGPLTFTIPEAAKLLRVSRGTAYEAAKTGTLPTIRFGRTIRVPRHALLRLLNGQDDDGEGK